MAETTDLQRLVVSLEANLKKYENSMKRASGIADTEGAKIESKFKSVNTNIQAQTSNLAAQFQDIAVSLQGGQSPLTVALQQGTQIGAVLGPAGAAGAVKALGAAFLSVLSPVNLATIGLIAAGGAAIKYFTSADEVKTVDQLIKEHAATIGAIKEQYGKAVEGVGDYVKASSEVLTGQLRLQFAALTAELDKAGKAVSDSVSSSLPALDAMSQQFGGMEQALNVGKYEVFRTAIEALRSSAAAGTPDFVGFRDEIIRLTYESGPATAEQQKLAQALLDASAKGVEMQQALQNIPGALDAVAKAAGHTSASINALTSAMAGMAGIASTVDDAGKALDNYALAMSNAKTPAEELAATLEYQRAQTRLKLKADEEAAKAAEAAAKKAAAAARRSAAEDRREEKAERKYEDTVKYLELEIQKAGLVGEAREAVLAKEREIQMLRRAGVTEMSAEGQVIVGLVRLEYEREAAARKVAEAQKSINSAAGYAGNELVGALDGMITRGRELDDVLQDIIKSLIRAALQAAILGQGPLAGIMGTAGANGATGGLIGALLPGRASGGPVRAGQAYKVGERGSETFVPNVDGVIVPNKAVPAGGGGRGGLQVVVNNTNADNNRVSVQERQDSSGMKMLEIMVEGIMTQSAAKNGGFAKALQMQYGLRRGAGKVR